MIDGQGEPVQYHCPRCGGPMRKPAGSTLYWHVNNNHPRCDITNIVEAALEARPTEPPVAGAAPELPEARRHHAP